jgi:hypothetical protein
VDLAWLDPTVKFNIKVKELENYCIAKPDKDPEPDTKIIKSGRTTGVKEGTIKQTNATLNVNYGEGHGNIKLKDQIIATYMSDGGDSGSAVFIKDDENMTLHPVGLLFAGSDRITVLNRIDNVLEASGMTLKHPDDTLPPGEDDNNEGLSELLRKLLKLLQRFLDGLNEDKKEMD